MAVLVVVLAAVVALAVEYFAAAAVVADSKMVVEERQWRVAPTDDQTMNNCHDSIEPVRVDRFLWPLVAVLRPVQP